MAHHYHRLLPPGWLPYKSDGVLVVSLCGVNCRFWSHLGCLGWKVTVFAHSLTPHISPLGAGAGLIWIFRQASPSLLYGSPPGLLARTTGASSTVTGSNSFPATRQWLKFYKPRRRQRTKCRFFKLKTEFPFFQSGSRLLQVACFVKCWRT